jgi:hypothetical protein
MRNKAIYPATLLFVPAAAALIANAPVAAAQDANPSTVASATAGGTSAATANSNDMGSTYCFPPTDVRTAQQATEVKSACTP